MKRKLSKCIQCGNERHIYSRSMCQPCYWNSRPKKPITKKPYTIRKRSVKGQKEDREYSKIAKKFKEENPYCKARLEGCTGLTTDVHHRRGRGKYYLDVSTFIPLCRSCHTKIELNPEFAKSSGFSFSRLTKE